MARDASGNYTLPGVVNPVVSGTPITITWGNSTLADIQTALTDSLDRQGRGSMTQPLKLPDGTAALPALTFANDTNTGIYRIGNDSIGFVTGAALRATLSATGTWAFPAPSSGVAHTIEGDGISDTLRLNTASGANYIGIQRVAGQLGGIELRTGAVDRWLIAANATAESGANAGSNLNILAFDDAGTLLGTPFQIVRNTGGVVIPAPYAASSALTATPRSGSTAILASGALVAADVIIGATNADNTSGTSNARFTATSGGASGGDALFQATVSGVQTWSWGVDNSAADGWALCTGGVLGTANKWEITTAGNHTIPAPSGGRTATFAGPGIDLSTSGATLDFTSTAASAAQINYYGSTFLELVGRNAAAGMRIYVGNGVLSTTWSSAGNVTGAAPSSGVGLTWTGVSGANVAVFNGGTSGAVTITSTGGIITSGTAVIGASGSLLMGGHISRFESAEQTCPSTTGVASISHGGSRKPDALRVVLRCKTAEAGYSVNDEADFATLSTTQGVDKWSNLTTVGYAYSRAAAPVLLDKGTAAATGLTAANWRVVYYAIWL
jgi:hypothetical protein